MDGSDEEIGVNKCVGRHTAFMGIRYNLRFSAAAKAGHRLAWGAAWSRALSQRGAAP